MFTKEEVKRFQKLMGFDDKPKTKAKRKYKRK
jgi:hypothetical protein